MRQIASVRIDVASTSFTDHALSRTCRRRLEAVLARYADLVSEVSVRRDGSDQVCVEVVFRSGLRLSIEQHQVEEASHVLHLADRVGRTVARRVALGGFSESQKT